MTSLIDGQNPLPLLDPERLRQGPEAISPDEIVKRLRPYVSDERAERIEEVVAARTYAVAPVIEGLADSGNASAVIRSAEALGYQPFHVVIGESRYKSSTRTTQGAEKWLDLYRWQTAEECVAHLRQSNYFIAVTHLGAARTIGDLEFGRRKIALVFGNEKEGISPAMAEAADTRFMVPMCGFGQSFNISVAAGICLYQARLAYDRYTDARGDLTPSERAVLRADFYLRSVKQSRRILQRVAQ